MARAQTFKNCGYCGERFGPLNHLSQKFCSKKCSYSGRKTDGKKGKHYPHLQRARIGNCKLCGDSFRAVKDDKNHTQRFCSKECWSKRNPPRERKCLNCGDSFKAYGKTKVYCGQRCRDFHYRDRFSGVKSHRWKGGLTEKNQIIRMSATYRRWRSAILRRDGNQCTICQARPSRSNDVILHVDHIKPFSIFPKLRFELSNGRTLCLRCHKQTPTYAGKMQKIISTANRAVNV